MFFKHVFLKNENYVVSNPISLIKVTCSLFFFQSSYRQLKYDGSSKKKCDGISKHTYILDF